MDASVCFWGAVGEFGIPDFKEALIKSARADSERFWLK
jgi:hypothetical protein